MPYLALILLSLGFIKTCYYVAYEIKEKQNKPGGIAVFLLAMFRTYLPKYRDFYDLYIKNSLF